jgi:hypothetical protein
LIGVSDAVVKLFKPGNVAERTIPSDSLLVMYRCGFSTTVVEMCGADPGAAVSFNDQDRKRFRPISDLSAAVKTVMHRIQLRVVITMHSWLGPMAQAQGRQLLTSKKTVVASYLA